MTIEPENDIIIKVINQIPEIINENPARAEMILNQALKCEPEHVHLMNLSAIVKHKLGKLDEAIQLCKRVLEEEDSNQALNTLSLAYSANQQWDESIKILEKLVSRCPDNVVFLSNLGLQYKNKREFESAIKYYREAIRISPDTNYLYCNLADAFNQMKDLDNAIQTLHEAKNIDKNNPAISVDLAYAYNLKENYKTGLAYYEDRFSCFPEMQLYLKCFDKKKKWDGKQNISGKRIMIHCEQGMGDGIMFSRYLKFLKDKNAHIIVQTNANLGSLLETQHFVDEIEYCEITKISDEDYDFHAPIMSLPFLTNNFEIDGTPYIQVKNNYLKGDKLKVGFVWKGSPLHPNDLARSLKLEDIAKLLMMPEIQAYNFQLESKLIGETQSETFISKNQEIEKFSASNNVEIIDLAEKTNNMLSSAEKLSEMDLFVCCDTSYAHLAGSIGKRAFMLTPYYPDWRWGNTGDKTKWYDSLELVRQEELGSWGKPVNKIYEKIKNISLKH